MISIWRCFQFTIVALLGYIVISRKLSWLEETDSSFAIPRAPGLSDDTYLNCDEGFKTQWGVLPLRYYSQTTGKFGRCFDKITLHYMEATNMPPKYFVNMTRKNADDFVLVTGASSNHFAEVTGAIEGMQAAFPNHTIIVYDLGLRANETQRIKQYCNVVYKVFNFDAYPQHTRTLRTFAFKMVIIIKEATLHQGVLWFDSSIRLLTADSSALLRAAAAGRPLTFYLPTPVPTRAVTHPATLQYLPIDPRLISDNGQKMAGFLFVHNTAWFFHHVLWPLLLCALQEECIAPTRQVSCTGLDIWDGSRFSGCHRFDQSVVSVVALNAYNGSLWGTVIKNYARVARNTPVGNPRICRR